MVMYVVHKRVMLVVMFVVHMRVTADGVHKRVTVVNFCHVT